MRGKLLVSGQFLLLGLLVIMPRIVAGHSPSWLRLTGYLLIVTGTGLAVVAALRLDEALTPWPEPRSSATLRTEGIYAVVRHPIYTGVLLIGYGLSARSLSVGSVAAAVALTMLLAVKARYEERLLGERYPEYSTYCQRVPRFMPGWRPG